MTAKKAAAGSAKTSGPREWLTPARIAVIVLTALAIVFIFENTDPVEIRILVPLVTMPLYLALLAMFVIGALCGGLFFRRRRDR
ncbi:LapA family protein [Streptomyces sp. NBC_00390]|uniref:LapA family protein n=1 Tax=Streptomyces sp. NBC_00390 TaxID=2975736 RepID=UPI002E204C9D